MLKKVLLLTLLLSITFTVQAQYSPLEGCLQAVSDIKSPATRGDYSKVEYLNPSAEGIPTYEIEIEDADGREWEFMCDATQGTIYEIEQEVSSANNDLFNATVNEKDAIATVLQLYGGEVIEVEYEIESDGSPSYEIDIQSADTEWKIEVDATTGKIIEVHVEEWEIGIETEERK